MATNGENEGGEGTPEISSKYRLAGEEESPTAEADSDTTEDEGAAEDADVIDLDEARETREEGGPSFMDSKLGQTIRSAFRDYVLENVVPKEQAKGTVNVNLDPGFLRDHGAKLVSNVFQQVVQAFVPPKVEMAIPVGQKGEEADEGAEETSTTQPTSEGDEPDVDVSLNFDVLNFVKDFFKPKAEAADEAEEAEAEAAPTAEGDDGDETTED